MLLDGNPAHVGRNGVVIAGQLLDDARSALRGLGYSATEANRSVEHVTANAPPFDDLDPLIRACLQACRSG